MGLVAGVLPHTPRSDKRQGPIAWCSLPQVQRQVKVGKWQLPRGMTACLTLTLPFQGPPSTHRAVSDEGQREERDSEGGQRGHRVLCLCLAVEEVANGVVLFGCGAAAKWGRNRLALLLTR